MSEEIVEINDTDSEKVFLIIWKKDSPNPGLIEHIIFKESELCDHNKEEVLGPYRDYVEAVPGSRLWHMFVDSSELNQDHELWNHSALHWDWEKMDVEIEPYPEMTWDDIKFQRNQMLASSDSMFNFDTPEPLKQQWIDHRELLRNMIDREKEAGRTPDTVFWNDYLPPFPLSARGGLTEEEASKCVWYIPEKKK